MKMMAKSSACPSNDAGLKLPPGFCATIFADDIGHTRQIAVAPNGVVYANIWSGAYFGGQKPPDIGFLVALQDKSGSGKADSIQHFGATPQTGGHGGTGIVIYKDYVYAELNDKIMRYPLNGGIVSQGDGETVVSGLPLGGDHPMHPFIIGPDGMMYVDMGTATNSCQSKNRQLHIPGNDPCVELQTRGGTWRFDANKTDQKFSPAERYATGIRNGEGYAFDSAGRLFVTQHGRDQLHANWPELYKPEEEATLPAEEVVQLKEGGDYGWPECYYDAGQKKLVLAPEYGGDGGKKVGVCAQKTPPAAAFPAHWGPNAMAHYDQKQFPARYRNGLLIAFHGSWDRAPYPQSGYNVVFQPMVDGHASGNCEIFADGFAGANVSPDGAAHRPTGLAVAPDGALFVSDDVKGRIYRITYEGGAADANMKGAPCPSASAPAGETAKSSANPPEGTHADAGKNYPLPEGATRHMAAMGDRLFHGKGTCIGCHGENGGGSTLGPDLTDQKWIWSDGSFAGIKKTISDGVNTPKQFRSPMPPMKGVLTDAEISALSAYVWGLSHQATASSTTMTTTKTPSELSIPGEKVYPESLTSTSDGRVIIGSIGARTIYSVKPGSATAEPWIQPDDQTALGILGVFADNKANTLWACFSSAGPASAPKAPSVLKAFDLKTGELKQKYPLPTDGAFCNDIAVAEDGAAYISDTNSMQIDRLAKGGSQLEVWAGNGGFGAKGGVLDGISVLGDHVIVNTLNTSKLFSVPIKSDGSAGAITEIKLDKPIDRPDGMRAFGKDSVLIIEGGPSAKLSKIIIHGDSGQVTNIKEGCPDGPVSVAVLGTTGYVLGG
ncbi:MAG TPA: PQQ-dependent sugar dehydrogenase, partial [Terriglobales bacterium]